MFPPTWNRRHNAAPRSEVPYSRVGTSDDGKTDTGSSCRGVAVPPTGITAAPVSITCINPGFDDRTRSRSTGITPQEEGDPEPVNTSRQQPGSPAYPYNTSSNAQPACATRSTAIGNGDSERTTADVRTRGGTSHQSGNGRGNEAGRRDRDSVTGAQQWRSHLRAPEWSLGGCQNMLCLPKLRPCSSGGMSVFVGDAAEPVVAADV